MADRNDNRTAETISEPFRERLSRLGPEERVRAIVLIRTPGQGKGTGRRQSREERQAKDPRVGVNSSYGPHHSLDVVGVVQKGW